MPMLDGGIGGQRRIAPAASVLALVVQFFAPAYSVAPGAAIVVLALLAIQLAARMRMRG